MEKLYRTVGAKPQPIAPAREDLKANSVKLTKKRSHQPRRVTKVAPLPPKKKVIRKRSPSVLVYAMRLAILGVGLGAIAGTVLSTLNPTKGLHAKKGAASIAEVQPGVKKAQASLPVGEEILPLKAQIKALVAKNPKLQPGAFFVDLDTGNYVDWEGSTAFSAASTIKFPILVAFFQDLDAKKIRLDEKLTLTKDVIGSGSGTMQYQKIGTQFTTLETITKTIAISDNTATNMIIKRLGGIEKLNQRFQGWGLRVTTIRNPLPDLEGTNTTSPKDLATLMAMVDRGELMSLRSRDRLLEIMRQTVTNTLLTPGLGKGATIAHKTGDIGSLVGDIGLIDMPSGKRYIASVMVKRKHNDRNAQELIRQMSRITYQYFSQKEVRTP
ncbi:MAG: class A beta-lactamase-related serine hydrolase [Cyanosarcina radialis HA8281-LM2]|nr:class A beta-lactamase-related serine hydrolase [Cyanosarcina radialis HA8281-LM2]